MILNDPCLKYYCASQFSCNEKLDIHKKKNAMQTQAFVSRL